MTAAIPPQPQTRTTDAVMRQVVRQLTRVLGRERVLATPEELIAYEFDGTIERGKPQVVVFPESTEQVSAAVRVAWRAISCRHARFSRTKSALISRSSGG